MKRRRAVVAVILAMMLAIAGALAEGSQTAMDIAAGAGETLPETDAAIGAEETLPETDAAIGAGETLPGTDAAIGAGETLPGTDAAIGAGETLPGTDAAIGAGETLPETDAAIGAGETLPETDAATGAGETLPGTDAVAGAGEAEAAVDGGSEAAETEAPAENARALEVYFFDLERVDAILIRCEGVACFVDVGFKRDAEPVLAGLRGLGVEKLDCYIATHGHADHVGGSAAIIDAMRPNTIYVPHKKVWSSILNEGSAGQRKTCEAIGYTILRHGDIFPLGGATVKCIGPIHIRQCSTAETKENSNSLVFKLIYGQRSFLFTGDTTDNVLREVNREYPGGLRCDVLKNPHHNGTHAADVVEMIQPKLTVFCTSNDRQPDGAYVRLLKRAGSESLVTCSHRDGNVLVRTDGVGLDWCCGEPLTKVSLNPAAGTLVPGQQARLTGTLEPSRKADPKRSLIWTSSDERVAQVSGGVVTAVGDGVAVITATSINGLSDSVEVRVSDVGILIRPAEMALKVGQSRQIETKLTAGNGETLAVTWESGDESVAVVTQTGEVLAAGPGETTVVARLEDGAEAVCRVEVSEIPAASVRLDRDSLRLKVGGQAQLTAKISPSDTTDKRLEWASSDESVATVDAFGTVTAVGKGSAKIGVRAASGVYDLCRVKVE